MRKAIVWSKQNCPFCDRAKQLLTRKGIEFENRMIDGSTWTREQLLAEVPTARSVPQIFLGEEYVGGFTELEKKLSGEANV